MQHNGGEYADVLRDAQDLGYAELDPTFDVGGIDAAHKLALLSAIAFGTQVNFDGIYVRGIQDISLTDIHFAQDLGYAIKLLAFAQQSSNGVEQRVEPCLIPYDSLLGSLHGVTNAVVFNGDFCQEISMTGPGAGEGPTASAVVADIIDIAKGENVPVFGQPAARLPHSGKSSATSQPAEFYVRLLVKDQAGVLAKIAEAFAQQGVSLKNMHQPAEENGQAIILIVTHTVDATQLRKSIETIAKLPECLDTPVTLRIQD
jgi:homoserine dehydrogenase